MKDAEMAGLSAEPEKFKIPPDATELPKTSSKVEIVPGIATELSQEEEAPEIITYDISFKKYNPEQCRLNSIDDKNARAVLIIIRNIGLSTDESGLLQMTSKATKSHVVKDGDYKYMYKTVTDDDEIEEIILKDDYKKVDIRLFYCVNQKIFNVIAIRSDQNHIDTSNGNYKKKSNKRGRY